MKRRITDLFKTIFRPGKKVTDKLDKETVVKPTYEAPLIPRKKTHNTWLSAHNQYQANQANKVRRRRSKNKVARTSRQINYRKAS